MAGQSQGMKQSARCQGSEFSDFSTEPKDEQIVLVGGKGSAVPDSCKEPGYKENFSAPGGKGSEVLVKRTEPGERIGQKTGVADAAKFALDTVSVKVGHSDMKMVVAEIMAMVTFLVPPSIQLADIQLYKKSVAYLNLWQCWSPTSSGSQQT
ncbi:hypothetical protein PoB_005093500 [Plakobranchus ocellatus]|uniref:Uncharacterized protein n=1 Tax=Plakobranchus ocellatus TaxID=259542 RepID=A0AAV4BVE2_9GAST|nr:hypothetical protein PoB_005093500 [Plakobranchus ocellatus]